MSLQNYYKIVNISIWNDSFGHAKRNIMQVYREASAIHQYVNNLRQQGHSVGFVPTMGALHKGHLSLIEAALKHNDFAVLSIFINPTQFNKAEDLQNYPRNLEADLAMVQSYPNLVCFTPPDSEMYGEEIASEHFDLGYLAQDLEGRFRPGHFQGVATVVKRLLHIVNPHNAYFGEKDFQQLKVIERLVQLLHLSVNVVGVPIVRESSGLAMSSRNGRLSERGKQEALIIYRCLQEAQKRCGHQHLTEVLTYIRQQFEHSPLNLEYAIITDSNTLRPINKWEEAQSARLFIAAYCESVRLIDNERLF